MTARHRRKLKRKLSEDTGNLPNHIDMTTNPTTEVPTWDQLIESVSDGAKHPEETNWAIYRYLRQNYKSIGSKEARMLLSTYMKLRQKKPSLNCVTSYVTASFSVKSQLPTLSVPSRKFAL